MNIQTQLEQVFGFTSLKPFQQEVIDSMLMDDDILVISPTGSGKSLCFQLPALLQEGMTIVLSPLRSLIYDQVEALRSKGVNCDLLNGDLKVKDRARVYGELSKKIPEINWMTAIIPLVSGLKPAVTRKMKPGAMRAKSNGCTLNPLTQSRCSGE